MGARKDGDRKRMEFALPHHNNPEGVFVASDWLPSVSMVNRNYSVGMEPASAAGCCGRKLIQGGIALPVVFFDDCGGCAAKFLDRFSMSRN
ncbi:hypothetical protein TNIN_7111 [Trichonephila inaurata madagascariensis]|uniref:Uncharacterized protein n=1 Tax=Trichonephila inaurata madagascariensis TaxID=2747483 RepID=A0A8X6YKR5_9ARAC|nr:hypothetical protein TNIN_7111 [Trichonephila inaurata madagascariensis]